MGEEESKCSINKAIEAISSLISLSHSIKSFNIKWNLIRAKLDELYSGLAALQNLDSCFDPSLSSLISAVLASLRDCYDLATRCVDVSYTGKLLMQSDLDLMAGRFDRHTASLARIYSAGILSHGFAIVVSKPSSNACCREDMRFYVKDLMTRMKIGDVEMKKQALSKLNEAMEDDDRYVKIVVDMSLMVDLLVVFLDSEAEIQEESAKALLFIAMFGYRSVLVGSGVIGPLIRVLESGNDVGREASARCLMKLTENSENAWSVSAHGGVSALLKICSCSGLSDVLIATSCGVLRNLVGVEEIKRYMIEEDDTLTTFIKLIGSKEEIVQVNTIDLLLTICCNDEETRGILVSKGGIKELVSVLSDPNPLLSSSKTKEIALRAIDNLCFGSFVCLDALLNCEFLDHLLYLLSNGDISVQESALKVTSKLCSLQEEVKRIMGDAGFMPELVKFLDAKSLDVREMASAALYGLLSVPRNRKKFAQDDYNISYILKLLDHDGDSGTGESGNAKFLISILMSLTSCTSARRKIASSRYLKSIEKLAESEGSDAKRLVKKLSMNRFRSLLSGMWHS